jgi:hypothetical protein
MIRIVYNMAYLDSKIQQYVMTLSEQNGLILYGKQDQQGKAAFSERNLHTIQRPGAKGNPKQNQERSQCRARTG